MDLKKIRLILSFLSVLLLSACGYDPCVRSCDDNGNNCIRECGSGHCVDADDWGYPKIWVPANGNAPEYKGSLRGAPVNAYVDAIDSKQVLLDADKIPLVVTIGKRDQWTSWFGGDINLNDNGQIDPSGYDGGRTVPDRECDYYLADGHSSSGINAQTPSVFAKDLSPATLKFNESYDGNDKKCSPLPSPLPTPDAMADCQVPCNYRNGMGLYVGLAPNNSAGATTIDQVALAYHIPDSKAPDARTKYDPTSSANSGKTIIQNLQDQSNAELRDGYLIRGLPAIELQGSQTGDRLFFKIVDKAYVDNSGGYMVKIKEGTRNVEPGPLKRIVSVFVDPVNIIMQRVYNGIVSSSDFRSFVQALLVLYIAFFGYNIMIGGPEALKKDVFVRILKVSLIMVLIGDSSWDFFYNHLFSAFINGVQGIAALLMNPFGDFDPNDPWYSMDQALFKLWSVETWTKISATLISNFPLSIIFIPGVIWGLVWFMIALGKALIVYLMMFAVIAILITLAPIFLIFMLFEKTKDYTKEWFDQLFVAGLQQIILMAALGMFASVIVMYLQKTVGYNVCWNVWLHAYIFDFKFWMPDISADRANVWMDANGDGIKSINEMSYRYIDAPYLDPIYDKAKLAQMVNYEYFTINPNRGGGVSSDGTSSYYYISIVDLIFFVGSVYLMRIFMPLVETVAKTLKSGSSNQSSNVFSAGNTMAGALNGIFRGEGGKGDGLLGGTLDNIKSGINAARSSETRDALENQIRTAGRSGVNYVASKFQPKETIGKDGKTDSQRLSEDRAFRAQEAKDNAKKLFSGISSASSPHDSVLGSQKVMDMMKNDDLTDRNRDALREGFKNPDYKDSFLRSYEMLKGTYTPAEIAAMEKNIKLLAGEATIARPSTPIDPHKAIPIDDKPTGELNTFAKKPDGLDAEALRKAEMERQKAEELKRQIQMTGEAKVKAELEAAEKLKAEKAKEMELKKNAINDELGKLNSQLIGMEKERDSVKGDAVKLAEFDSRISALKSAITRKTSELSS